MKMTIFGSHHFLLFTSCSAHEISTALVSVQMKSTQIGPFNTRRRLPTPPSKMKCPNTNARLARIVSRTDVVFTEGEMQQLKSQFVHDSKDQILKIFSI
jgi:hypothetical protein